MSTYRWFLAFFGAGLVLASLVQAMWPLAAPCAQGESADTPSRVRLGDGLPAGAIARLGTPQQVENNTFARNYMNALYVTFLPDGRTVATAGPLKKLGFFEARTGKQLRALSGYMFVALSPDGTMMATKEGPKDTAIRLVDVATEKVLGRIPCTPFFSRSFCYSPDGKYLVVGGGTEKRRPDDLPLRLWAVPSCKLVREFPFRDLVNAMVYSPDGKTIATVGFLPRHVKLWDVAAANEIRELRSATYFSATELAFSPDSSVLVGVGNVDSAWNAGTGSEYWRVHNLGNWGLSAAFSPNGQMVAVGMGKGSIQLREAATGRERFRFEGQVSAVYSVAFSPCGLLLASVGHDCAPLVWDVTGLIKGSSTPAQPLGAAELDAHWDTLRRDDAAKAWKAILALAARPEQAVPMLKDRLAYRKGMLMPKRLAELLANLDSDAFATREEAGSQLTNLGPVVSPALQKLSAGTTSREARRRADDLLAQIAKSGLVSEPMLQGRVLEVLEYSASPAAKELLEAEAREVPASPLARDAKAALDRIAKRPTR